MRYKCQPRRQFELFAIYISAHLFAIYQVNCQILWPFISQLQLYSSQQLFSVYVAGRNISIINTSDIFFPTHSHL